MKPRKHDPAKYAKAWFSGGLKFKCTGCGACCQGGSGRVWVDIADIGKLASHFGLSLDDFGRRFLTRVGARYALLDNVDSGDCIFLSNNACSVYESRPAQCRAYPWWPEIVDSAATWQREAASCEGISADADTVSHADIIGSLATITKLPLRAAFDSSPGRSKVKTS